METKARNISYRMLVLIAPPKQTQKAEELFRKGALPLQYRFCAEGTASSEIMDMLGLGGIDKNVLISMMPKRFADIMLEKLYTECKLHTPGSGIAFTVPLTGANNMLLQQLVKMDKSDMSPIESEEKQMPETTNVLIAAIVNRGYSEQVMEAARSAGAKGGTVIHSRQIGTEEVSCFWGISVQDEKEIILILSPAESKVAIMRAVSESCGVQSDARGIIMSMPIDSVIGI